MPQTKIDPIDMIDANLELWRRFCQSRDYPDLGYPSQSAEQVIPITHYRALPAWETEMHYDWMVRVQMPWELSRVLYAAYEIPLRAEELRHIGVSVRRMRLKENSYRWGRRKYSWDSDRVKRIQALRVSDRVYHQLLKCGKYWILARENPCN